jgi:hypothetical protein
VAKLWQDWRVGGEIDISVNSVGRLKSIVLNGSTVHRKHLRQDQGNLVQIGRIRITIPAKSPDKGVHFVLLFCAMRDKQGQAQMAPCRLRDGKKGG